MAGESGDSASRLRFKLKSVGMRKGRLQAVVLIHDDAHVHFSDTVYLDSERERLQFARQAIEYLPEGVLSLPDIQKELLILYGKVQEAYEASRRHPPAEYRDIHGRLLAKGRYWRAPSHSGGRILAIVPDWFDLLRARLSRIPDEHEFEGGESGMPLANFDAWLVEEIVLDDEAGEPHIDVVVAGQLEDGEPQPPVRVSAVQFGRMDWVLRRWGARALIHPGKAQHLRAAIQALSGAVPRRVVFTHSGFRLVDGRRVFLHAGGALGPDGPVPDIDVELPAKLSRYRLPVPPADAAPAVRALLGALDVTDRRVTLPLLAAAAAAPLDSTVGPLSSVLLLGPTGSRKSSLIGLLLHLYGGSFTAKMPVTTWADTPNSLEQLAHAAKYLPLWVDDIRPPATSTERAAQEASLQRLLRGVVTRSGRGRLATDLRQERVYMPRGLVVTSAEQVPEVASTVARLLVVRVAPMNLRRLTEAQRVGPELFPAAGAAWIQFLVRNLDELATAVPERASRYRDALLRRQPLTHGGVADSAGLLHACGSIFLSFAVGVGAIEADEARQLTMS